VPAHARSGANGSAGGRRSGIQKRPAPSIEEGSNVRSEPGLAEGPLSAVASEQPDARGLNPEDYLLAHLLREPDSLIWLAGATAERELAAVEKDDWQHVENQEIFRLLKQWMSSDDQWDVELFQESLPGLLHGRLARLMAAGAELPAANGDELRTDLLKVVVRLRLDRLKARSTQVKFLIDEATHQGERDDARDLFAVNNQLLRDLSHLQLTYRDLSRVLVSQRRAEQGVKIR
jgi:hypothetical protein